MIFSSVLKHENKSSEVSVKLYHYLVFYFKEISILVKLIVDSFMLSLVYQNENRVVSVLYKTVPLK